jgi:hypothetical protein
MAGLREKRLGTNHVQFKAELREATGEILA